MAFENSYEHNNVYGYTNHQSDSFTPASLHSQFSNYEQIAFHKEPGLQSAEHGIIGPTDHNTYSEFSRTNNEKGDYSNTVHDIAGYPSATSLPINNAFSAPAQSFHTNISRSANEQHTGNNAFSTVLQSVNDNPGESSLTTGKTTGSSELIKESMAQPNATEGSTGQNLEAPKNVIQNVLKGNSKVTGRNTAHDRSKLTNRKQQRRVQNPPEQEKSANTFDPAATSTDPADPFTQWYQMMSQYYSQFYPGYQLPQPPNVSTKPVSSEEPKGTSKHTAHGVKQHSSQVKQSGYAPTRTVQQNRPGCLATNGITPNFDYAAYYYQYYYEAAAAAAAQMWSGVQFYPGFDPSGRQTPKLFSMPHVRGGLATPGILLQILPNRPSDGELARVELLDMSVLANDAVAEATKRATEVGSYSGRLTELRLNRDADDADAYSSSVSGLESPERLSSMHAGAGGDDDGEEVRACAAIAIAWDRTDHVFYPGPLSRTGTLKADVLVYLRDKLAEIQDRLPIDWESAGLLITYLEFMVKNNGNVQPSDLVRLLLEGHEPQTSVLRANCSTTPSGGNSYAGIAIQSNLLHSARSYISESLASLPPSQVPSGRQSPQTLYGISDPSANHRVVRAASETGGFGSTQALLRRAAAAVTNNTSSRQLEDDKVLDRFRELLMHGMSMKALEHACRSNLWGHAFVLAQRLGPTVFTKVMERFLTRAIPPSDPILTLYQLTAGELPSAVSAVAYGRGSDNGEWRPHLAMILASESTQPELTQMALERLGDSLLSRRLVYAAHLCYLLMGPLVKKDQAGCGQQPVYQLPEKIWLLGVHATTDLNGSVDHRDGATQNNPLNASTEAIQLTEIYEYAMRLANQNYRLPQLLPFKLVYATRLIDAGLLDKAYRYLSSIGQELLLEANRYDSSNNRSVSPVLYSMVANCLRLIEPLQSHPELDGFDLSGTSRTLGLSPQLCSSSGGHSDNFLQALRDLYNRLNRQLTRAQYTHVIYPVPKQSTDTVGPSKTSVTTEPVVPQMSAPDLQSTPALSDPHHQSVTPRSIHSSTVENSNTAPPVTAYLVHGQHHSMDSQGFVTSRSEVYTGSYDIGEHTGYGAPSTIVPHNHPVSSSSPDRADTMVQLMTSTPGCGTPFVPRYDSGSQLIDTKPVMNHASPPDQHTLLRYPDPTSGPDFHSAAGSNQGGQAFRPTLFGIATTSTSDGFSSEGAGVPTIHEAGTQLQASNAPERLQPSSNLFFTPVPAIPNEFAPGSSPPTTPAAFDYFAGLHSSEVTGSRSRTVSGCSQGSTVGGISNARSRNSSGVTSRRGSTGLERVSHIGSNTSPVPPQTPKHLAPPNELQQRPIKEEPFHTVPDDRSRPSKENAEDGDHGSSDNAQQSKDGWFSGLFGRLKRNGSKNVHLPDDSKPSIVWDDERKQWVDVTNPEANDSPPPPPPMITPNQNTSSVPGSGTAPIPPGAGLSSPPSGRGGTRSRYVNVLANQTAGSTAAKLDVQFQPPLPVTGAYSRGPAIQSTSRHTLQHSEHNLRPAPIPSAGDPKNNNNYQFNEGSSGLMMYR